MSGYRLKTINDFFFKQSFNFFYFINQSFQKEKIWRMFKALQDVRQKKKRKQKKKEELNWTVIMNKKGINKGIFNS